MVKTLQRHGIIDSTYLIVTSDHGYHMGQFALPVDKRLPYETDIRVPLLVRGPDVPANVRLRSLAVSIDIAPTVLDMAGIRDAPADMDGVSLMPLLRRHQTDDKVKTKQIKWINSISLDFFNSTNFFII